MAPPTPDPTEITSHSTQVAKLLDEGLYVDAAFVLHHFAGLAYAHANVRHEFPGHGGHDAFSRRVITDQRLHQAAGLSRDLTGELLGLGQLHDEAVQYLHVRGRLVTRTSAGAGGGSRSPAGAHTVAAVRLGQ